MILADKITEERKRNGWSQEELAEKLNVSRQSVSKWESAQSVPDLGRILQMANLFGVTTDYLLKDELEKQALEAVAEPQSDIRRVSMEEASQFIQLTDCNAPKVAFGGSLCVASPIVLLLLAGLSDSGRFGITESLAAGVGVSVLLLLVAAAVAIFIRSHGELSEFEYLENEIIETAYGVEGMAREEKRRRASRNSLLITIGAILCICSSIPLLLCGIMEEDDMTIAAVALLLLIVAIAVNLFVRAGMSIGSFDKLLQIGDYSRKEKKAMPLVNRISGIYWLAMVAIFLGISFLTDGWDKTWIIWPVAGVVFALVIAIAKAVTKNDN